MKGKNMRYLLPLVLLMAVVLSAGCFGGNKQTFVTTTTVRPFEVSNQTTSPIGMPTPIIITEVDLHLVKFTDEKQSFSIMIPSEYGYCRPHNGTAGDAGEV